MSRTIKRRKRRCSWCGHRTVSPFKRGEGPCCNLRAMRGKQVGKWRKP